MADTSRTQGKSMLFTLGYGNRSPVQLFDLIKARECNYLADVRSAPYSSYHKEFNRETLERECTDYGLKYLYLGDQLGGKPNADDLDEQGHASYKKMAQKPNFIEGIDRLETAQEKGVSVALMCAELRPESCHRAKLIGESLAARGITLYHIDEAGKLLNQSDAMQRLTGGQDDLFTG